MRVVSESGLFTDSYVEEYTVYSLYLFPIFSFLRFLIVFFAGFSLVALFGERGRRSFIGTTQKK